MNASSSSRRRSSQGWSWLVLGFAVAATLGVAAALVPFGHPQGDDYCRAARGEHTGALECFRYDYVHWDGRWAELALNCWLPSVFDYVTAYPIALGIILVVCLLVARYALATFLDLRERPRLAWGVALAFMALYWAGIPHPGQTLYWLTGAYTYSLGTFLPLLLVAFLIRQADAGGSPSALGLAAIAPLALISAGFHEMFGGLLVAILFAGAVLAHHFESPARRAWVLAALLAGVGLALLVGAPGNANRTEITPQGGDPVATVYAAGKMWLITLQMWVLDAKLVAATLVFALAPPLRDLRPAWLAHRPALWKLLLPVGTAGLLTLAFLAGGWALGRRMPDRAYNGLYLIFLLGWFLTVLAHKPATRRETADGENRPGPGLLATWAAVLLALGLLVSPNFHRASLDLRKGWALDMHRAMQARYRDARALVAEGGGDLVVPALAVWPESYFDQEIGPDPEYWRNECMADYWQVDSIRTGSPAPPDASSEPAGP